MVSKYFFKIEKLATWVLFFVIIAYAITGYGMTKGIIDSKIAHTLHLGWLGAVGLVAFVVHTAWSISMAFKRWGVWNILTKILLAVFYIALISFFIYIHFFYQSSEKKTRPENINNESAATTTTTAGTTIFTAETLAKYNGLNGQPTYIAVDGIVYDVSSVFINGKHYGWSAGQDLSSEFYQQHSASELNGYTIVGTYQTN